MLKFIKRLFKKKSKLNIGDVSGSCDCIGCNKEVNAFDYLYIHEFGDEFQKHRCKKCVTEIVKSGRLVEIL